MDATDARDASAERNVELVAHVGPEQWDIRTPCAESSVRSLVGHLITGRQAYCELLRGVPAATLRPMLERQRKALGTTQFRGVKVLLRSVRTAFAESGALERTVHHHPLGNMPGSKLLVQLIGYCVVHSWDLATALWRGPELDEQFVEFSYGSTQARPKVATCMSIAGSRCPPDR